MRCEAQWFPLKIRFGMRGRFLSIMEESGKKTMLSDDIRGLLSLKPGENLYFGEIAAAAADRGFGILLVLLSLPSALPVPAPGYSTPFGIVLFILGAQMLLGRARPWIPLWAARREIKRKTADKMISGAAKFFSYVELFIRPRFDFVSGKGGGMLCSLLLLLMSGLMILPIPLTNTLPAMVIFCIGVALTERDGLAFIAALCFGAAATALYALVFWVIFHFGAQGIVEAKEIVKGWFF